MLAGCVLQKKLECPEFVFVSTLFSFVFVEFRFNFVSTSFRFRSFSFQLRFRFSFSLTKQTQANKLLLSCGIGTSVTSGVVVSGGGMSTKSVGGSDGSEVEAGVLVSCDRYFFDFD